MHLWFDTDAFVEYSKVFKLGKFLKINEWESYLSVNMKISYLEYIRMKHSNFITKLISCEDCLLVWVSILICLIGGNIITFPIIYMMTNILRKILCKLKKY
jgi:hypothetical protein